MAQVIKRDFRLVAVDNLQEGMVIKAEVVNNYGNVLLPEGTVLKDVEKIKIMLELHNIRSVKIKIEEAPAIDYSEELKKKLNPEELEELLLNEEIDNFKNDLIEAQENIKDSFKRILKGEAVEKTDLEENIKITLDAMKGKVNVFQLLERMKKYDDLTYAHSQNVALISYAIGKWINLSEEQLENLTLSAVLLDIGKIQVPKELLNKKGRLTQDEMNECKKHVVYSHELIKKYNFINDEVKKAVLFHHERVDGSGYPMGLKAEKIPLLARIIAIADVYNALTSDRPYRSKHTPFKAIKVLEQEYMDKLDSTILYTFLQRIGNCFIGQNVTLSDGTRGKIIFMPKQNLHRPIIKVNNSDKIKDLTAIENKELEIIEFN